MSIPRRGPRSSSISKQEDGKLPKDARKMLDQRADFMREAMIHFAEGISWGTLAEEDGARPLTPAEVAAVRQSAEIMWAAYCEACNDYADQVRENDGEDVMMPDRGK